MVELYRKSIKNKEMEKPQEPSVFSDPLNDSEEDE